MGTPSGRVTTRYSEKVPGAWGNHGWPVRFDVTEGYVGISQETDRGIERVLLSQAQFLALVAFVKPDVVRAVGRLPKRKAKR